MKWDTLPYAHENPQGARLSIRTVAWWCVFAHLSFSREQEQALAVADKHAPVNPYSPALNTSQLYSSRRLILAAESSLVG